MDRTALSTLKRHSVSRMCVTSSKDQYLKIKQQAVRTHLRSCRWLGQRPWRFRAVLLPAHRKVSSMPDEELPWAAARGKEHGWEALRVTTGLNGLQPLRRPRRGALFHGPLLPPGQQEKGRRWKW